jgi:transposase
MPITSSDSKLSLFQLALGIQAPWFVKDTVFSKDTGRLDIYLDFEKDSQFVCPLCGENHQVHGFEHRSWRHLNFFQYHCHIHAPQPRVKCGKDNKTINVSVPWARPNIGFTLLFEAFAIELANHMPLSVAGDILGIYDNRLMRIVEHYVFEAREKVDMSEVKKISVDETSKAKGHNYVSVFTDLDEAKVLFVAEGRESSVFKSFTEDLKVHNGKEENISTACMDLSKSFIKGAGDELPQSQIVFDKFHVVGYVNKALDEVRRQEQKANPLLNNSRYAFLHNPENTTEKQKQKLDKLCELNLKTVRAYNIKLALQDIYSLMSSYYAEQKLKQWYFWATHCRLQPIIDAAKTIKRHWKGIIRYFKDRVTNGLAEGINGIIQTIKRQARGYRNTNNFITMIYLRLSKLQFNLPSITNLSSR